MAGASVKIKVDDKQFRAKIEQLSRKSEDLTPALRDIGGHLERSHEDRFVKAVSPAGQPWAKLSPVTISKKKNNIEKILQESGELRDSLHFSVYQNVLEFGTNKVYGATHQFGARRGDLGVTKRGDPIPWGDIPERPFIGLSDDDIQAIDEILTDHLSI
jgi:phage virion morphogenesis protein